MNVFNLLYQPNTQQLNTYLRQFRYSRSIFRVLKTSGLKPVASDKRYYFKLYSLLLLYITDISSGACYRQWTV